MSAPEGPRAADERGSGTILMVGVVAVVLMLGLATTAVASYLIAAQRARSAADLTALGAAQDVVRGGSGCAAAGTLARANGARLVRCERVGDQIEFVVTVRVEVPARAHPPGLPRTVAAVAHAGLAPEAGS